MGSRLRGNDVVGAIFTSSLPVLPCPLCIVKHGVKQDAALRRQLTVDESMVGMLSDNMQNATSRNKLAITSGNKNILT
jgi:hypothetical protein